MAQKLSAISALMLTNAAAVGSSIGTATTAEVQSLARILTALSTRPDLFIPAVKLAEPGATKEVLVG